MRYNFVDEAPLAGWNYYRLRQTDYSGENSLSDVRPVFVDGLSEYSVTTFPNPVADDNSTLLVASEHNISVSIKIFNQAGEQVKPTIEKSIDSELQSIPLEWQGIESGYYLIVVSSEYWTEHLKVVVF